MHQPTHSKWKLFFFDKSLKMETKGKEAENYISALQRKNKKRTYNDNKVTNIRK